VLAVSIGEIFAVERQDNALSGFRTDLEVPEGVDHLGTVRRPPEGFGGAIRVLERFRCTRAGRFSIGFVEGRAWESDTIRKSAVIDCG